MGEGFSKLSARFVANMKRAMTDQGISQTALANKAEISQGMVSLILSSQRDPTLGMVGKIADALDVAPGDLLNDPLAPSTNLAGKGGFEHVDDSHTWLVRLDADLKIEWANHNLLDYHGLNASDVEGLSFPELMKAVGRDDLVTLEEARLEEDRRALLNHELVMYTEKDENVDMFVVKVPLADGGMLGIGMPLPDQVALDEIETDLENALKLIRVSR